MSCKFEYDEGIHETPDNGWDVDKTLKLLHKSNPTVFEWFLSPIVYQATPFADRLSL